MSSQFKFKPDKIKYLSTIDTLDSSHKKIINGINKKRDDVPKKEKRLLKIKNELELLDSNNSEIHNYITIRTKLIDEINNITEEIDKIENYEDELEYYEKTHEILLNYYDIIDGHKVVPNNINNNSINNIDLNNSNSHNFTQFEISDINPDFKTGLFLQNSDINNNSNTDVELIIKTNIISDNKYELYSDIKIDSKENILNNNKNTNINVNNKNNDWEIDGIEIFKKTNDLDRLDILNQLSKLKRKEKTTTRRRVKNVESLFRDSNNIFDYLEGTNNLDNNESNNNSIKSNSLTDINNNVNNNTNDTNNILINKFKNDDANTNKINIKYDRASLFEDYKILLEGYPAQKKTNKPCMNCGPLFNKVLIYSEGMYVCLTCGEVEKCIIENEISNYKDPMVEKPTFPYKRKNHFCEWINYINIYTHILLLKVYHFINDIYVMIINMS